MRIHVSVLFFGLAAGLQATAGLAHAGDFGVESRASQRAGMRAPRSSSSVQIGGQIKLQQGGGGTAAAAVSTGCGPGMECPTRLGPTRDCRQTRTTCIEPLGAEFEAMRRSESSSVRHAADLCVIFASRRERAECMALNLPKASGN